MPVIKNLTFCHQCKVMVESIRDLFFVEDKSNRGFCSESCIESYFSPIVEELEKREAQIRKSLQLEAETVSNVIEDSEIVETLYHDPDEVWIQANDLGDNFYSYIKNFRTQDNSFWLISICFVFNEQPSFIFSLTATKSLSLLKEYRIGEQININELKQSSTGEKSKTVQVDEETMQALERKKGIILAELLSKRSPKDIDYEEFDSYLDYISETMDSPDEVYSLIDEDGDSIYHYIRAYEKDSISFYYIIICLLYQKELDSKSEMVIPVLAFPTIDPKIYKIFKMGKLISGNIKS